jgi:pSer/pThr/pTyr-binding forkhead associated (FHA) protein
MYLIDDVAQLGHDLAPRTVTLGRDPRNAVLIHDATVSRFHGEVTHDGGRWTLHVTGTTGAEVNGERVEVSRVLAEGDRIGIGTHTFRVHAGPLPAGVRPYAGHDVAVSDPLLHHATATMPAIVPLRTAPTTRKAWHLPLGVAVVIALALVLTCAQRTH